jgi:hypothetical protein
MDRSIDMSMNTFKDWYMDLYWKFDNLFLVAAKFFDITYHEFVLISLCIVWPTITLGLMMVVEKLWRDRRRLQQAAVAIALIVFATPTWAGPSPEDMNYSIDRPLKIITKVSNGTRFDLILPTEPFLKNHNMASWYQDQLLVIRDVKSGQVQHTQTLKSDNVTFVSDKQLSSDFVVISEWSGGASCCLIVHVYQTKPSFEKLLEHNNDFFDSTDLVAGPNKLELYKKPWRFKYPASHAQLKYTPRIFDLRLGLWQ